MGLALGPMSKVLSIYLELINRIRVAAGKRRLSVDEVPVYMTKATAPLVLTLAPVLYHLARSGSNSLIYVAPLLCLASILAPVLVEGVSYGRYVRNLREDLMYFMLVEGVSPGDDLVRDLEEGSEDMCAQLETLCNEHRRLKLFLRFFPGMRGIREYVLRAPKPMRRTLLEYIMVRETGNFNTWVYSKFQEALHELRASAKRSLELKTLLTLLATVFSGLPPPLIALVMSLGGGIPPYFYPALFLPGILLVVSESSTPRLMRVSSRDRGAWVATSLRTLALLLVPAIGTSIYLLAVGVALCALGSVATVRFARTYAKVLSLPLRLVSLADRIPYSRDPTGLVEENLGSLRNSSTLASLCYIILMRSIKQGNVNTARIVAFKEVVEELFSLVRQGAVVRSLVLATALILPFTLSYSISLAMVVVPEAFGIRAFCFASSLFYSIIATWVAFGSYDNGLLVGSVLLLLYALGVVP